MEPADFVSGKEQNVTCRMQKVPDPDFQGHKHPREKSFSEARMSEWVVVFTFIVFLSAKNANTCRLI